MAAPLSLAPGDHRGKPTSVPCDTYKDPTERKLTMGGGFIQIIEEACGALKNANQTGTPLGKC